MPTSIRESVTKKSMKVVQRVNSDEDAEVLEMLMSIIYPNPPGAGDEDQDGRVTTTSRITKRKEQDKRSRKSKSIKYRSSRAVCMYKGGELYRCVCSRHLYPNPPGPGARTRGGKDNSE